MTGMISRMSEVRSTRVLPLNFVNFSVHLSLNFLSWQADIVREYKRDDQFITQNFDFDWTTHSIGYQSQVDQYDALTLHDSGWCRYLPSF